MKKLVLILSLIVVCSIHATGQSQKELNEPISADSIILKAVEYANQKQLIETGRALRQAWVLGEKEQVEEYLRMHPYLMEGFSLFNAGKHEKRSNSEFIKGFTKLDSLGFREGAFLLEFYHAVIQGDSVVFKFLSEKSNDPFALFMIVNFLEVDTSGRELSRQEKLNYYQRAADVGCLLAYNELAVMYLKGEFVDGKRVNTDLEKGVAYFQKAYESGCLRADGIDNFLRTLEEHPEIRVSPEYRHNLYRLEAIGFDYWFDLMKRVL